ncbi:MAG: hypothetical protein J3R72DRAFT_431219 [Linnemannia gamsii]|nr:MAG: hypothetical protein J3R72DRAFT_431219 [Linnemannia gamsii]
MDGPSDNIRTAIGVSVGLTSGLVILYYFVRLCRIIAMYPKHDEEEVLPAYQPPSFLPATVNFCHQEYDNEHLGRRSSRNSGSRPSTRNLFRDLRRERVPTTTVATTIPTTPSPAYSSWSRNSGYYHNGEMTQVGGPSSLPPGTFVIPMPPAPARPPRSLHRSAGLGTLTARPSGQPLLLPVANNNTSTGAGSEPPPPSYSEVVGESSSQPMSSNRMAGTERISHPTTIV